MRLSELVAFAKAQGLGDPELFVIEEEDDMVIRRAVRGVDNDQVVGIVLAASTDPADEMARWEM